MSEASNFFQKLGCVSDELASEIESTFGERTMEVILNHTSMLAQVPGVTVELVVLIKEHAERYKAKAKLFEVEKFATQGPWQIRVDRPDDLGFTVYYPLHHVDSTIAIGREYWPADNEMPAGYEIPTDDCGYIQPDRHADICVTRIANAILMAHVPDMIAALRQIAKEYPPNTPATTGVSMAVDVLHSIDAAARRLPGVFDLG